MKKWLGTLTTVWLGLSTHKLRSFLTILGVVIGVASVITLMSIGKGSTQQILSNIQSMGANLISIRPGASMFGGVRGAAGGVRTLTMEDADAIAQQVPNITAVSPSNTSNLQLVVGGKNTNSQVNGVNPEYFAINNINIASGAFFSEDEYQSGSKVAVLGSNVATTLFPNTDPIGQQMRMGTIIVRVIGVLESKGAGFNSPDDGVYIPLTAMQQAVAQPRTPQGGRIVSTITLTVSDSSQTQNVIDAITSLLRTRHHLGGLCRRRFQYHVNRGDSPDAVSSHGHVDPSSGRCGRHFTAGGGHRRDEHHAGIGAGENQRDRHTQGARSQGQGHMDSVPD